MRVQPTAHSACSAASCACARKTENTKNKGSVFRWFRTVFRFPSRSYRGVKRVRTCRESTRSLDFSMFPMVLHRSGAKVEKLRKSLRGVKFPVMDLKGVPRGSLSRARRPPVLACAAHGSLGVLSGVPCLRVQCTVCHEDCRRSSCGAVQCTVCHDHRSSRGRLNPTLTGHDQDSPPRPLPCLRKKKKGQARNVLWSFYEGARLAYFPVCTFAFCSVE